MPYAPVTNSLCEDIDILDVFLICRYMDGERLSEEDEKTVLEKLLAYHPRSEDKVGCGLNFIMVSCRLGGTSVNFSL